MTTPGRSPTDVGPNGTVALVVGGLLVLGAWVWGTGQMAGWVHDGRWPRVGVGAVPGVMARIPGAWPSLRQAWPEPTRDGLPGTAGILAVAAILLAAAAVVTWAAFAVRRHAGGWPMPGARSERPAWPDRRNRAHMARPLAADRRWSSRGGGSRAGGWAGRRDLRTLRVSGPGPGRLVLGRARRALLATEARHSVLVLGPTQSGKTTGLAIPAILEWSGPVVATSVKDDLVAETRRWRARQGRCWVFDPTGAAGQPCSAAWSPLAEANSWSGAQRMASWLVEASPARGGLTDGAFWFSAAAKLLGPLLLAAWRAGGTMSDVVRWNNLGDLSEPLRILDRTGDIEATVALAACDGRDERLRSSVGTTLETVLAPFEDPVVAASTSHAEIDPAALLDAHHSLYLCGPSHEQFRVQGLFAALVGSVVAAAVDRVHATGRPLDPPLLLVLDEAANIAPIRDLDTLASTAAGLGIQLVTVCQDLGQLASRYDGDRARTIANNHRAKILLSGVSDLATLDLISGLAGERAVHEETVTADLRDGRRTRSSAVAYRRLAPADELRRVPPGHGILVYGHLPAARIRLRPWFRDRRLRARVAGPASTIGPASTAGLSSTAGPASTAGLSSKPERRSDGGQPVR